MSATSAFASSVASAVVPVATAAFVGPNVPEELGLTGQIAEERTRMHNAQDWTAVAPWAALAITATLGGSLGYALVSRHRGRGRQRDAEGQK